MQLSRILVAIGLTVMAVPAVRADVLCIKSQGATRSIRIRSGTTCRPSEFSIGSFDGTTLVLAGINLQIVSGSGATDGAVNGKGNLIVGYNEDSGLDRGGSHNIVLGQGNGYSSFGGIVAGSDSLISGENASAIAADGAEASGAGSVVVGGVNNVASTGPSAVFGGRNNQALGSGSTVTGGSDNLATGWSGHVSGGACNAAGVSADPACDAFCPPFAVCFASVSGGSGNGASGRSSTVGGGLSRSATGANDWAAGSLFQDF
jgi:hypothetical protein